MLFSFPLVQLLVITHLVVQFWLVFYQKGFPEAEAVFQYLQLLVMAILCYSSYNRFRRDQVSLQKRFIFHAFLIWVLRYYVDLVSHGLADMMSLAVVWCFTRSQTHVLNLNRKAQKQLDISFLVFELMLFTTGLLRTVQPGVVQNTAHTFIFTISHLLYIALIFLLYARAVVATRDPSVRVRFVFLMTATVLYTGLFLSDFIWRSLVPGATGNLPAFVKDVFDALGMIFIFAAFNMSDKVRSLILIWHRLYRGQTQQRLISLVLAISEAAAREEDHILPSLAIRVAKRLQVSAEEQQIIKQAGSVLAIIHRNELPKMHQQWQDPKPLENAEPKPAPYAQSPFEDRLAELERVQKVIDALDLPYAVNRGREPIEAEILRVVYAYLVGTNITTLIAARGIDYAPRVVDALAMEISTACPA